jgi:hypothetical protein
MNKILVIRFGKPFPIQKEMILVQEVITDGSMDNALGAPMNGAVVSVFTTAMSAREVSKAFHDLGEVTRDEFPTVVKDLTTGETIVDLQGQRHAQKLMELAGFSHAIDPHNDHEKPCVMTLDQLLDKVRDHGRSSLSEAEMKRLQELSK